MAGYTPLFSSLTTGTLYGRWPDIGLWAVVLSLPDKGGIVDRLSRTGEKLVGKGVETLFGKPKGPKDPKEKP